MGEGAGVRAKGVKIMNKLKEEIIALLKSNARLSFEDIAKMLNIAVDEVEKIVHSLEQDKVILQYTIILNEKNLEHISKKIRALIEIGIRPESRSGFDHIAKRIAKFPQVINHYLISGNYDFLIIVEGETLEDISRFVSEKLASIENIRSIATHFIMKKYKENGIVMEEDPVERLAVSA